MTIDLSRPVFSTADTTAICEQLAVAATRGLVVLRHEANPYLQVSYQGAGTGISPKWNVKVYTYSAKKGGHSIVCVDKQVLAVIVAGDWAAFTPPELPVLRIDDAGWGFPLCGVMVGITDEQRVEVAVVPVEYFQATGPTAFDTKLYLHRYAEQAEQLLARFGAAPPSHRIEICSGYVNQPLRERLRATGYDVRVVEVRGRLQEQLEEHFRAYVQEQTGADLYYDPKAIPQADIPRRYRESLTYGQRRCPQLVKTGWQALQNRGGR